MRLSALVDGQPGLQVVGDGGTTVTSLTSDSRRVRPGALFAALRGVRGDGHRFVAEAVDRGASAVLVQEPMPVDVPQLVALDSRVAVAHVAAAFHGHPSRRLRVIGVTGTAGKTTTGHLLEHILTRAGRRTGLLGSLGARIAGRDTPTVSRLTTPFAEDVQGVLHAMVQAGVEDAVLEASSAGLAEHRLDAIGFTGGIVTNVSAEHLEVHGGLGAYRRAKARLAAVATEFLVVDVDDDGARRLLRDAPHHRPITVGVDSRDAEVRAVVSERGRRHSRFELRSPAGRTQVHLPLPGRFNVSNAVCAAAAALHLGIELPAIADALASAPSVDGRMQVVDEGQPFAVYVDYAHTLAALDDVLTHLRWQHLGSRVITVFGTGLRPDSWKRPLAAQVLVRLSDVVVFTAGDSRLQPPESVVEEYAHGADAVGAVRGRDYTCVPDRRDAIGVAVDLALPGDVVAVLGKGHEGSILIGGGRTQPWSEVDVVRAALRSARSRRPA